MEHQAPEYLDGPRCRLAYRRRDGAAPTLVWVGGYRSDMLGTKANFIDSFARSNKRSYLRFDYAGHGESDGVFEEGCIGDWLDDARCVIAQASEGPLVLIGSSMGAWISNLLALELGARIVGMILIAPATDFTDKLTAPSLTPEQLGALNSSGRLEVPSDEYAEPQIYTRRLFEDGAKHSVMTGSIAINCPIRILQGMNDDAVPWRHALAHVEQFTSKDVDFYLAKNGDHRLSTPKDLAILKTTIEALLIALA